MANVLQDYFDRMTALNRQRGMTGNMQYGKALDSSLAEGYFDSYEKNKAASETRANQKAQLGIMQQNADTSRAGLDVQRYQVDAYKDAQKNSNMWQGLGMGLNAVAVGAKAYGDITSQRKSLPMPETGNISDPTWAVNDWMTNYGQNYGTSLELIQPTDILTTTPEWDLSGDLQWANWTEPDFASSISIEAGW